MKFKESFVLHFGVDDAFLRVRQRVGRGCVICLEPILAVRLRHEKEKMNICNKLNQLTEKNTRRCVVPRNVEHFQTAHSFSSETSLSRCGFVIFLLSVSLFSLLLILKVSLLVLQRMAEKVKHTTGKEKKLFFN